MANINPTGIDEIQEKKWLISRMDLYHKAIIEESQNTRLKYESAKEQSISTIRSRRSYVLSGLGVILTVFLGYNSVYPITQWIFFTFLTGLGICGLITIVFFNWINRITENIFAELTEIFIKNIGDLGFSHGYMITSMAQLSKIEIKFIQNYFIFSMLLTLAISIRTSKSLKRLAQHYSNISQLKSELMNEAKDYEAQKEYIPQYYERLDRSQKMPEKLLEFIDKTLKDFKPKVDQNQSS